MKNSIFILTLLAGCIFSGCSTYYFTTVKSYENKLPQNQDGSYTVQKDNIEITYSFRNEDGDIVYTIVNKSDDPYLVDWDRSVLIVENDITQLKDNKARFSGDINAITYRFGGSVDYGSGNVSGNILLPQNKLFIPAQSRAMHSPISLFGSILNPGAIKKIYTNIDKQNSQVEHLSFNEENTPLKFKSYVTLLNDRNNTRIVFEDTFYISDYFRSGSLKKYEKRGNTFYFTRKQGEKALALGVVFGGAAAMSILLPDKTTNNHVNP